MSSSSVPVPVAVPVDVPIPVCPPRRLILVSAAVGDTGRATIDSLLANPNPQAKSISIRAFVRADDARAAKLRSLSDRIEVVVGDLLDFASVRSAMEGVYTAYFCFPISPGIITAATYFAQAAKETGVAGIVNMSQISARRVAKSHAALDHWLSERVFDWSGVPTTHVRPTFFAEWLLYSTLGVAASVRKENVIRVPMGTGKHAPIAAEDQGRFIAAVLLEPSQHAGKTYPLCGPVQMDYHGIAAAIGEVLGRTIKYEALSPEQFYEHLKTHAPEFLAQHLYNVVQDHHNGVFEGEDDIIEKVTGKPPMTVQQFIAKHRAVYEQGKQYEGGK